MSDQQLPKQLAGLSRLVQIEWEARQATQTETVAFIAVNDTHRLVAYDHALLWLHGERRIAAVSGGLKIEADAPQIVWFGKVARHVADGAVARDTTSIAKAGLPRGLAADFAKWVAAEAVWIPLLGPRERLEGGLIVLRAKPLKEAELRTLTRLGNAFGSALTALSAPPRRATRQVLAKRLRIAAAVMIVAGLAALRVPMTVLAEARVAPKRPMVVSAPIDGVIAEVAVKPNEPVAAGQLLLRFDATDLHAAKDVAEKRVAVLRAESQRAEAQAFRDPKARAEIAVMRAKLVEGDAENAYAGEKLARVMVRAAASGVALLSDVNEWVGRPVKVGERIMLIADPRQGRMEIMLAVEDALFAQAGAKVDFFLATAPSHPIRAVLSKVSYDARPQSNQTTVFIAEAEFPDPRIMPRLGLTGTAKIHGEPVSMAYLLLRKPFASLRRLTGF